uniref:Uncharacterized protein n=1 Tax=Nelumbo nucifera TaxID=4432 RepID=A0A822YKZ3_NELNU|nr:TPA_asm: hypothetical protein HUJ06_005484 [Nelumbo nucifera]
MLERIILRLCTIQDLDHLAISVSEVPNQYIKFKEDSSISSSLPLKGNSNKGTLALIPHSV